MLRATPDIDSLPAFPDPRPAAIVVVGHHPLILGLVNFALDLPWKILERRVKAVVEARIWPDAGTYEQLGPHSLNFGFLKVLFDVLE